MSPASGTYIYDGITGHRTLTDGCPPCAFTAGRSHVPAGPLRRPRAHSNVATRLGRAPPNYPVQRVHPN